MNESERNAILEMLDRAKEFNLEIEVVYWAMHYAVKGHSVEDACDYALEEWDI